VNDFLRKKKSHHFIVIIDLGFPIYNANLKKLKISITCSYLKIKCLNTNKKNAKLTRINFRHILQVFCISGFEKK
jgi:hypothetical protein